MDYEFKVKTAKLREKVEDLFEFEGCKVSVETRANPHSKYNHKVKRPLQNISHVSSLVYDRWEGAPTGTCTRRSGRTAPILRSTLSSRSKAQASPCPPAERSRSVGLAMLAQKAGVKLNLL